MSYTPTNWTTGDTITASALNKIEQGIADAGSGAGGVEITATQTELGVELDASYNDVRQILLSGATPYFLVHYESQEPGNEFDALLRYEIYTVGYSENEYPGNPYYVSAFNDDRGPNSWAFLASTATDNLVYTYD